MARKTTKKQPEAEAKITDQSIIADIGRRIDLQRQLYALAGKDDKTSVAEFERLRVELAALS